MNLADLLAEHAALRPDAAAIVARSGGRRHAVTFAGLDQAAGRAARLLRDSGVARGDAVLVLQPMSIELYQALLGLFRIGAVAMFLDPAAGPEHVARCCAIARPRALAAAARAHLLRLRIPALRRIPRRFVFGPWVPGAVRWSRSARLAPLTAAESLPDDAPALLTFTSGSTGVPKAALRTHGFLLAQHAVLERTLGLAPGQVDLTTLPIFLLANLASGVTSVVPDADLRAPGSVAAGPIVAQIREERPATTVASPALLERLATWCEREGTSLPTFERVYTGGAPVLPATMQRLGAIAPNAEIVAVYGSTEAEPIAEIAGSEITRTDLESMRSGAGLIAGEVVESIDLRILPDRWGSPIEPLSRSGFDALRLPRGAAGEIVVSGDHVLPGYFGGVGDEETKFRVDGRVWHRTGDAGRLDETGRLWLLGRCDARIEDGRGRLYPFGVECAASRWEGVRRCAFVAHDGRRVLVIEREAGGAPGPDAEDLRSALAWAEIDEVRFMDRIPLDARHNAKIDYPALRRLLA